MSAELARWCAAQWPWLLLMANALALAIALGLWRATSRAPGRVLHVAPPLLGLLLFAALALAHRADLGVFEIALMIELQRELTAPTLRWWLPVTHAGDGWTRTLLAVGGALWLARTRPALAGIWLLALAGIGALTRLFKLAFTRARPQPLHDLISETSWSFPSGHAAGGLVTYGLLACLLLRVVPPRWQPWIVLAAAALIVNIGASRVLLQVHYGSDVLAGFALGAVWLALCLTLVRRLTPASGS